MTKRRKKSEPLRAELVQMVSTPCDEGLAAKHLAAFVDAFVVKTRRERMRWLLLEKPARRSQGLGSLQSVLDGSRCQWLLGQSNFPQVLAARWQNPEGVLVSADDSVTARLDGAVSEGAFTCADMVFSIEPGRLAFVLTHHGDVIECRRR